MPGRWRRTLAMGNRAWYRRVGLYHIRVVVDYVWGADPHYRIVVDTRGQELGRKVYRPNKSYGRTLPATVVGRYATEIINNYRQENR